MTQNVDRENTALLVIDVQQGMFQKPTPVYRAEQMLDNINMLIDLAHKACVPVIFIQHCDARFLVRGTPDWQLHPSLHRHESGITLYKEHSNGFENTNLAGELTSQDITSLVVTGMVTHGCVKNTCLGALALGYHTIVVEDGHGSFSKQADRLIEEWNKKLAEQGAVILPASEITFK